MADKAIRIPDEVLRELFADESTLTPWPWVSQDEVAQKLKGMQETYDAAEKIWNES
jgi:hypothetical protein